MARLVVFFALSCVCSLGRAQDSPDLSSIVFWAQPLSNEAPAVRLGTPVTRQDTTSTSQPLDAHGEQAGQGDSPRKTLSTAVQEHLESLGEEEALNGERSPALIDELTSLAELYQKLGDHAQAIAALDDAIQTIRINYGLYSLDQVGAVESVVTSWQAQGEYDRANDQRAYIRDLVRRNADDPRVVGVLSGLADSEMDAARRLVGVPPPAEINITSSGGPEFSDRSPSPQRPALIALRAARSDYTAAINAAVRTGTRDTADLFASQDALMATIYFEFEHPELHGPYAIRPRRGVGASPLAIAGAQVLRGKLINTVNFRRTPLAIAKALVELGDWYLVFSANGAALEKYQTAHDMLVQQGEPGETIDELLSPEIPVVLPVLPPTLVDTGAERTYRGYIDAAVKINRYGGTKSVDILEASSGTSKAVAKRLKQFVQTSRFRPRFVGGELARTDRFVARFYYDY